MTTLFDQLPDIFFTDPGIIQDSVLDAVEARLDSEVAVVPESPFMVLIDAACSLASDLAKGSFDLHRSQFPKLAHTRQELRHHMADADALAEFATPAEGYVKLIFNRSELINLAVDTGDGVYSKITIPKDSYFTADSSVLTMEVAIDILVTKSGGLQIRYGDGRDAAIYPPASNNIEFSYRSIGTAGETYVVIKVPVRQFALATYSAPTAGIQHFKRTYPYTNKFMHCRVYMRQGTTWTELSTTHSEYNYDPLVPTALLGVDGASVTVEIPQVYYSAGLVGKEFRIDVYTTEGDIRTDLGVLSSSSYTATWRNLDGTSTVYDAALTKITSRAMSSDSILSGGYNGRTFVELRDVVMKNAFRTTGTVVTFDALAAELEDDGFALEATVDNITRRAYVATRPLELSETSATDDEAPDVAGAGAGVVTIGVTLDELASVPGVTKGKGERYTITPGALFVDTNGQVSPVDSYEHDVLSGHSAEQLASTVNATRYLYSPFYTVVDADGTTLTTRSYSFESPSIETVRFVGNNYTTGRSVTGFEHNLSKVSDGVELTVSTLSDEAFKQLSTENVQAYIAFIPDGESEYFYLTGEYIGTSSQEWVYRFKVATAYDVDADHRLGVSGFKAFSGDVRTAFVDITQTFKLILVQKGTTSDVNGKYDSYAPSFVYKHNFTVLYVEDVEIKFGDVLDNLWSRTRTVVEESDYLKYENDVFQRYTENVFERLENGDIALIETPDGPRAVVKHRKGDIVYDDAGNAVILHAKYDPVYDDNGDPVVKRVGGLLRYIDLTVIDGVYYFANTTYDTIYKSSIVREMVSWMKDKLSLYSGRLLEETSLIFRPTQTLGRIGVSADGKSGITIYSEQATTVYLYVNPTVYRDLDLRKAMARTVRSTLASQFDTKTVSVDTITTAIKAACGSDLTGVRLSGIGGRDDNYSVITVDSDARRLRIGKVLRVSQDGFFETKDAITIVWKSHEE